MNNFVWSITYVSHNQQWNFHPHQHDVYCIIYIWYNTMLMISFFPGFFFPSGLQICLHDSLEIIGLHYIPSFQIYTKFHTSKCYIKMCHMLCVCSAGLHSFAGVNKWEINKDFGLKSKISGEPEISFDALICHCHQWVTRLMSLMCSASAATGLLILDISGEINGHTIL